MYRQDLDDLVRQLAGRRRRVHRVMSRDHELLIKHKLYEISNCIASHSVQLNTHQNPNHRIMIRIRHIIRQPLDNVKKTPNKVIINKNCPRQQDPPIPKPRYAPRSSILIRWILDISYNKSIKSRWRPAPPSISSFLKACIISSSLAKTPSSFIICSATSCCRPSKSRNEAITCRVFESSS